MKILAAIDKFKGSLTSLQAAEAVKAGFIEDGGDGNLSFDIVEMADGGDGSASVLQSVKRDAAIVKQTATDPLGVEFETSFLLYPEDGKKCAFIEMAKVSGLELLPLQQRNPMVTTTYGLGQLVMEAWHSGASEMLQS